MKEFLALVLILGLIAFCVHLAGESGNPNSKIENQKSASPLPLPGAKIGCDDTGLNIQNAGGRDWPMLELSLNDRIIGYHCLLPPTAAGAGRRVELRDCVKISTGERFDPRRLAVLQVWIGGNGFDYEKFEP